MHIDAGAGRGADGGSEGISLLRGCRGLVGAEGRARQGQQGGSTQHADRRELDARPQDE